MNERKGLPTPVHYRLPGGAEMIFIPKGSEQNPQDSGEKRKLLERCEKLLPSAVVREATQDIITLNSDAQGNGPDAELTSAMIKARKSQMNFEDLQDYLEIIFNSMQRMVSADDVRLIEARLQIDQKAEEIWTAPEEELAKLSRVR